MWQDNPRVYQLDEHRFVSNAELEAQREQAYREQVRRFEESLRRDRREG